MRYRRVFEQNSYIFLTIVTSKRRHILIDNVALIKASIKKAKQFYSFEIFGIVILPDHFHILIRPETIEDYPKIIRLIKADFSKNIDVDTIANYKVSASRQKKKEKDIWQRRYWEHTIRDEADLYKHLDYIHFNPVKHNYVKAAKDWVYSSFKKFVDKGFYDINWGNLSETAHIDNLHFE